MQCLIVRQGGEVLRFPLPGAEARLGSDAGNEIVVSAVGVSRFHARIVPDAVAPRLYDLGSKNGLVVDGRRHREVVLLPGVRVQAGTAVISVGEGATSEVELCVEPREPWGPRTDVQERSADVTETIGALGNAGKALGLLREIDRSYPDDRTAPGLGELLVRLCSAIGAESAAVIAITESGLEPTASGGRPLDPALLALLAAERPPVPGFFIQSFGETRIARCTSDDRRRLAVLAVPAAQRSLLDGKKEVLELALESLANDRPMISSRTAKTLAPALAVPEGMVLGRSIAMKELRNRLVRIARSRADVLVLGETGAGKELVARVLHASGPTARGPFVAINCAAIPAELLEAELFGVRPRAATGVDGRPGRVREAEGGTLVLDEVEELPASLQAKLLRFLQEREIQAIGASGTERVNVRVISVSNRDLEREVQAGRFRADLYHRIRGLECRVPALRDCREDIPSLVEAFAAKAAEEERKRIRGVSRGAMACLVAHDWPGNIRELQVEVRRAVVNCPDGGHLSRDHFADAPWARVGRHADRPETGLGSPLSRPHLDGTQGVSSPTGRDLDLKRGVERLEVSMIRAALEEAGGNRTKAAGLLGVTRAGLRMKLRRLLGGA